MNNLLFIYGTLLDEDNEFAIYLKNNSTFYSEGRLRGKLYDIGEYPGAVLSESDDDYIYGTILQLDDAAKVLPVIDDYEGFGEGQQKPYLFVRVLTEAYTEDSKVSCWVYEYHLSVDGLSIIRSGRY